MSPRFSSGGTMNTGYGTDFAMPSYLFSKSNNLIAKLLLSVSAEFSWIDFFHALFKA